MEGWIKLHRNILKWEWYEDTKTFVVFIDLLLNANHEDRRWRGVEVPRGHLITGRKKLSKRLGLSERSVRTALNHLISTNEVTIKTTKRYSLIKINKWDEYQLTDQQSDQQATKYRPSSDHKQEGNKGRKKEIKNIYTSEFEHFWDEYPKKVGKGAAFASWKKRGSVGASEIVEALKKQREQDQWKQEGGKYIPNPATWINQRRWEDEVKESREVVSYK